MTDLERTGVLVLGAGLQGAGVALELARRGIPVTVVEQDEVALNRASLRVPPAFPEKYREAILRAIDQCAVKRHLVEPPAVEVALHTPAWPVSRTHSAPRLPLVASSARRHRPSAAPACSSRRLSR